MNWALALYSALTWVAQPLLRRKLRQRARAEPGYGVKVQERFGHYEPESLGRDGAGRWVWVHAVSLGETRAAAILITALRAQMPGMRLLLTHGTATGRAEGQKLLRTGDLQVWQPWDTRGAVERFVAQFRPAVGVLMETEVWPNLAAICRAQGVPLALANARLNSKSLDKALKLSALSMPAYQALAAVWAQTQTDAQRLRALAAPVRGVLGNLKFDVLPDAAQLAQGAQWRHRSARPVVMLASSREGEEALFIDALRRLGAQALKVQWLVVPRHPQRFDTVALALHAAGLRVSRRSEWLGAPPRALAQAGEECLWLGDSLGEMPLYYGMADAALLGGSFEPFGGQNLIEAAACGCPMLVGPSTFNFAEAAELACAAGAARRVADLDAGVQAALALVHDVPARTAAVARCLEFAQAHRGAAQATAQAIEELLRSGAVARR
ncbi:3-deoxy-D-manno-octulosonic acid transferase [Acidovorax sp. CCYZU-2555]|uniref:3-deoxy-D-manno-octulosonic acid transferase n=1 Tax=Acidovorax sp. CCYZU-2555 TaxID=2835042 RepID=UPI001BCC83F2|nr:3-deoxy-D-manno-octulosonic acid transferase [Acidovorax sp. CCYZU-2555]MBS7776909.1 3-deoxy-D-manno-octulosonic acid transferase [Acidovorax sp. CCYZU-2555]